MPWGRSVQDLCRPHIHGDTKAFISVRESIQNALELTVVTCILKLNQGGDRSLGSCLETSEIEQSSVHSVDGLYSVGQSVLYQVEYGRYEECKKCRFDNVTLFHASMKFKGLTVTSVIKDSSRHAVVEESSNRYELLGEPSFPRIRYSATRLTESNAFVRSMKAI